MPLSGSNGAIGANGIQSNAVTTAKIADDAVTYAKIQDVTATDKVLGRSTSGAGVVEEIACTAPGRAVLANGVEWTTYTPTVTLVGGAGNTVPEYGVNMGRYYRVGNVVFVDIRLGTDGGAEGAGTGRINIALPVAAAANNNSAETLGGGYVQNSTNNWIAYVSIAGSASTLQLAHATSATAIAVTTGADQNNATRTIRLHFWYEV